MHANPARRGLLAGLLALVTFASCAVAMTAHRSSPTASTAAAAAPVTRRDGDRTLVAAGVDRHHR